jgi:hypothetical protein
VRRKGSVAPHVTETVESEAKPEFFYSACHLNPLRIVVRNAEGRELPERSITVIHGSRDRLIRELRAKADRIAAAKPQHGPSIWWGKGGEPIPYSKARVTRYLTDGEIGKIRVLFLLGVRKCDIARRFGCGYSTIKKALQGIVR